jgi:hypothetical protein
MTTSDPLDPAPAAMIWDDAFPPPQTADQQNHQSDRLRVIAALILLAAAAVCGHYAWQAMTGG